MMGDTAPVAVIGAGPYGLATAAHLRARGIEPLVFGEPMSYWERHMPAGMFLRSSWRASEISSPGGRLSLDAYEAELGRALARPVPREAFVEYGRWFQRRGVPAVHRRRVTGLRRGGDGFELSLDGGDAVTARRVVLATGLATFAWRPPQFERLPNEVVSHTADHTDLARLAGRRVLVVGAGQSAVECAALAHEGGAEVRLLAGHPVHWLRLSARMHERRPALARVVYAPHDVGPPGLSRVAAAPSLVRRFPVRLRGRITARCVRPAAAGWLTERLDGVDVITARPVAAAARDGEAEVRLDDGRVLRADHVLLGTGFRADVRRVDALAPELAGAIRTAGGSPVLGRGLETSVAGLHVVGALAAYSYGPVMRFVSGTWYAAPAVAAAVAQGR